MSFICLYFCRIKNVLERCINTPFSNRLLTGPLSQLVKCILRNLLIKELWMGEYNLEDDSVQQIV